MAHTHKGKTSKGEDQSMPEPVGQCSLCGKNLYDTYVRHPHGLVCTDTDCMQEIIMELAGKLEEVKN